MAKTSKLTEGGDDMAIVAQALEKPVKMDDVLAALGSRDRVNVERHLAAADAESSAAHSALWKRLVRDLATLSSMTISTTGQQALSFYIPDGKHRQQVFALEDQRDGKLLVYLEDVLAPAIKAGVIRVAGESQYSILSGEFLRIDALNAQNTPNPSPFYKHMLGWNRKALRVTLPVDATEKAVRATEQMCALSARRWQPAGKQRANS